MTTAHTTRRQSPARDPIGWLLLTGVEYSDARPWFGFVGAAVAGLIGATAIKVLL